MFLGAVLSMQPSSLRSAALVQTQPGGESCRGEARVDTSGARRLVPAVALDRARRQSQDRMKRIARMNTWTPPGPAGDDPRAHPSRDLACLLGEWVRFDGGHKRDLFLVESLGQFVDWVPLCPEVESGMEAPRESMRLVQVGREIRLLTTNTLTTRPT